jgi:hypothetical protein
MWIEKGSVASIQLNVSSDMGPPNYRPVSDIEPHRGRYVDAGGEIIVKRGGIPKKIGAIPAPLPAPSPQISHKTVWD